jgi:hypothetical protein
LLFERSVILNNALGVNVIQLEESTFDDSTHYHSHSSSSSMVRSASTFVRRPRDEVSSSRPREEVPSSRPRDEVPKTSSRTFSQEQVWKGWLERALKSTFHWDLMKKQFSNMLKTPGDTSKNLHHFLESSSEDLAKEIISEMN